MTIFWSWQSDSPNSVNRNFIGNALEKACANLSKELGAKISVDSDTRGVGGTPAIHDAILAKIRACDVFVWDATFITTTPRANFNPNVLMELGYAFAAVGDGRVIGVSNSSGVPPDTQYPFDIAHRRRPISYCANDSDAPEGRTKEKERLTKCLTDAIRSALAEGKIPLGAQSADGHRVATFLEVLSPAGMAAWRDRITYTSQYEWTKSIERFETYVYKGELPELQFDDHGLNAAQQKLVKAIRAYLVVSSAEHDAADHNPERLVASVKLTSHLPHREYDREYKRQLDALQHAHDGVLAAWIEYVSILCRTHYSLVMNQNYYDELHGVSWVDPSPDEA